MAKLLRQIPALLHLAKIGERGAPDFTRKAIARALRGAEVLGVFPLRWERSQHHGNLSLRGTYYALELRGKRVFLLHYWVWETWGSIDYDHVEEGLVVLEPYTGAYYLLSYWGQHAGKETFASAFPADELFAVGGPCWPPAIAQRRWGHLPRWLGFDLEYPSTALRRARPRARRRQR